ncbi:hypothetical protein IWX48DRAFT_620452 [Phyllosticta citricarpa]
MSRCCKTWPSRSKASILLAACLWCFSSLKYRYLASSPQLRTEREGFKLLVGYFWGFGVQGGIKKGIRSWVSFFRCCSPPNCPTEAEDCRQVPSSPCSKGAMVSKHYRSSFLCSIQARQFRRKH